MNLIALPTTESRGASRWVVWLLAPAAAIVAVAALWAFTAKSASSTVAAGGAWHRVLPADLEVKLVKDGELQAINNIEIQSTVEGQTTVQTLVKEGASVKKGDVLVTL